MAEETPEFDPRFDPAFQRGFDGEVTSARRATPGIFAPKPPAPAYVGTPPLRTEAPTLADSYRQAAPGGVAAPSLERELGFPAEAAEYDETTAITEDYEEPRRSINPFLIALAVLAVALIAGGLWALQSLRSSFLTEDLATDVDYVTMQATLYGAPLAIALGVATALGVLFILATGWRRRHA